MRPPALVGPLVAGIAAAALAAGAAGEPAAWRLPGAIVFEGNPESPGPVAFRHETHVSPGPKVCLACHPEPFPILRPVRATTHARMDAGDSCGACHDGEKAFGADDGAACEICHVRREGR